MRKPTCTRTGGLSFIMLSMLCKSFATLQEKDWYVPSSSHQECSWFTHLNVYSSIYFIFYSQQLKRQKLTQSCWIKVKIHWILGRIGRLIFWIISFVYFTAQGRNLEARKRVRVREALSEEVTGEQSPGTDMKEQDLWRWEKSPSEQETIGMRAVRSSLNTY